MVQCMASKFLQSITDEFFFVDDINRKMSIINVLSLSLLTL